MFKDIIKTLKIKHYIKNSIILIPLFFSMNYGNVSLYKNCLIIFISFCLISSAVYIMNDLIDIEKDKKHPIKCNRPIPSGRIPKTIAILLMSILILFSVISSMSINIPCLIMILSYLVLNIFYSFYLKKMVIVDIACIALGFVFRIISGCFAINVIPSPFVILMTFFCSMFFTFSKRKMELQLLGEKECRDSIKGFSIDSINQFILINAILSISFYFTYTMDEITIARAQTEYLYITTIPFTLLVFRLLFLINYSHKKDDPIILLKDKMIKITSILYIITFILVYQF